MVAVLIGSLLVGTIWCVQREWWVAAIGCASSAVFLFRQWIKED
jgi:1,4-dihydroxy-2-naphthoate octaprenyltransferase